MDGSHSQNGHGYLSIRCVSRRRARTGFAPVSFSDLFIIANNYGIFNRNRHIYDSWIVFPQGFIVLLLMGIVLLLSPLFWAGASYAWLLGILIVILAMVFAAGPEERITQIYSYFSLLPWGYAHFHPC